LSKKQWHFAVWKTWKNNIYAQCITVDDIIGKGTPEFYDQVFKITDDKELQPWAIEQEENRSVIQCYKNNRRLLLPIAFEEHFPVKVIASFECILKPSDKRLFQYVTQVQPMRLPQDSMGKSFREFIDAWNPISHSIPRTWTFLRILSFAARYKGVKCCVCTEPNAGKNANFTLQNHMLQSVATTSTPTPARLYEYLLTNEIVVLDEFTTSNAQDMRDIESFILKLGDNSTEYMKHSMAVGRQLKEADLVKKSVIFTYNKPKNLNDASKFFDKKWNNIAAFRSRYPQLYLTGEVLSSAITPSPGEIEDTIKQYDSWMKDIARQASYWVSNLHRHTHNYARNIQLGGRHLNNLDGLFQALDAYSESQEEFDQWCKFICNSLDAYKKEILNDPQFAEEPVIELVDARELQK